MCKVFKSIHKQKNLRECQGKFITVSEDIRKDINWFLKFTPKFNGTATFNHTPEFSDTLAIDASLNCIGGVWKNQVYTIPLPDDWKNSGHITHFEMLNVLIALKYGDRNGKGDS